MKKTLLAIGLSLFAGAGFAAATGEFNDECAYGLSLGKHVKTDCSVHEKIGTKTYCFSSAEAKTKFMADSKGNMKKAEETFGRQ